MLLVLLETLPVLFIFVRIVVKDFVQRRYKSPLFPELRELFSEGIAKFIHADKAISIDEASILIAKETLLWRYGFLFRHKHA